MAVEAGREYNPETATDLRPCQFVFHAYGETFRYKLEIPEYILARLNSTVMDQLHEYMNGYAEKVVLGAMRQGFFASEQGRQAMLGDVGRHLRNYIWERFSITQEQAGNDCWQTAPTLQEVHTR
jgi:hypothetical protein